MSGRGLWVVAVLLLGTTALQVVVLVLTLVNGEPFPWRTLSGLLTLIVGVYAVGRARRLDRDQNSSDT